jgi:Phage capsid-like protein
MVGPAAAGSRRHTLVGSRVLMATDIERGFDAPLALPGDLARALSRPSKSRPFWPPRTPRWILRCFTASGADVPVEGGSYHINRVRSGGGETDLPRFSLRAAAAPPEMAPLPPSVAMFDPAPQEVQLEPVQAIVRTQPRVADLFSDTHDQLQWQLKLSAEFLYEAKEDLVFNHPAHGLVHNVDPSMTFQVEGPPSPDVLDDLLARAWKRPDCFLMHPDALAQFHKQASAQGLPLEPLEIFGSSFSSWRGLPILPTNKLGVTGAEPGGGGSSDAARAGQGGAAAGEGGGTEAPAWLVADEKGTDEDAAAERPARGRGSTDVLLLRMGLENQGVVNLHAAGTSTHPELPFITVEFMGMRDEGGVSSYLLTTYTAVAVLSPGALAHARVTI